MASIAVCAESISALKKELRIFFPEIKSSHLSEAIAVALGRNTHASLINDFNHSSNDPPIELLDDDAFFARLVDLGYLDDPEFSFEGLDIPEVISTIPLSAYDYEYKSKRQLAWRNLMVLAINEGIKQKVFSLRPDDNRWVKQPLKYSDYNPGHIYDFNLSNGLPTRCYVNDAGWDELSIHVAVNPKGDMLRAFNAKFHAGDAFACSWLERRKGAWLQSSNMFTCRNNLINMLASLSARPIGFGDKGNVIL